MTIKNYTDNTYSRLPSRHVNLLTLLKKQVQEFLEAQQQGVFIHAYWFFTFTPI